jgi:hypothetical protein
MLSFHTMQPLLRPSNDFKTDWTLDITGNIPTGAAKTMLPQMHMGGTLFCQNN